MLTTEFESKMAGNLAPGNRARYITGGRATFTLVGKHDRFTYKVKESQPNAQGKTVLFVSVLCGSANNWQDYKYIGLLDKNTLEFTQTKNSRIQFSAPSVAAFIWAMAHIESTMFEFWHNGHCCICGRELTIPESIASGIGPICARR